MNKPFAIFFALFFIFGLKTYSQDFHQKESFAFSTTYSFNQTSQFKNILSLFNSDELNDPNIEFKLSKCRNIIFTEISAVKQPIIYLISFHSSFFTLISDLPPPAL